MYTVLVQHFQWNQNRFIFYFGLSGVPLFDQIRRFWQFRPERCWITKVGWRWGGWKLEMRGDPGEGGVWKLALTISGSPCWFSPRAPSHITFSPKPYHLPLPQSLTSLSHSYHPSTFPIGIWFLWNRRVYFEMLYAAGRHCKGRCWDRNLNIGHLGSPSNWLLQADITH